MCTVRFVETQSGDCGTQSYGAVFTGRIVALKQMAYPGGRNVDVALNAIYPNDLRLTVQPRELFKGHLSREVQIFADQGECFDEVRVGDDWLFFGEGNAKSNGLEISYLYSNPSGLVEERRADVERLRRLGRGDGLSYVVGQVGYPSFAPSIGDFFTPQPSHLLLLKSGDGKRHYSITTNAEGRFELGPISPGFFQIDANTDPRVRAVEGDILGALPAANGCSFVRIDLEINSEISGRVILPDGYRYKKSDIGNYFPLFSVDIDTSDGRQVAGTSIGDGLKFSVTGLAPGSYVVQLVNYEGETWIKIPVYAPGVTDRSTALKIDLGQAEHRTGLEIRVPLEALNIAK